MNSSDFPGVGELTEAAVLVIVLLPVDEALKAGPSECPQYAILSLE
jgi:hypothetical protein